MKNKELQYNQFYNAIVNSSDDAIITEDLNGYIQTWNNSAESIFGYSAVEIIGKSITTLFPEDRLDEKKLILKKILSNQKINHYETTRVHKNGSKIHVSVSLSPVYDANQNIIGIVKIARDITKVIELKNKVEHLSKDLIKYQSIVMSSDDAIISKDLNGIVTSWNHGAELLFGYNESEMIGKPMLTIFPDNLVDEEAAILERIANGEHIEHYETIRKHKNGELLNISVSISPIFDMHNRVIGASKIARNITKQVQEQTDILYQATHDSLTGLPNRKYILDTLETLAKSSYQKKQRVAFAIIDLDHFKEINDSHGHRIGDQVLIEVANLLQSKSKAYVAVGRMGGDEFVAIINHFNHLFTIEVALQSFLNNLKKIKFVEGKKVNLSASIGISLFPDDAENSEGLLVKSDQALYEAKNSGRNQFKFFSKELELKVSRKNLLVTEIYNAFSDNQFYIEYQPILKIINLKVEKLEALTRWKSPILGEIKPCEFIPIIEELGLIEKFTDWVIFEVFTHKHQLDIKFNSDVEVSINLSPLQLCTKKLNTLNWEKSLHTNHIKPESIIFEITENSIINNKELANENLVAIKAIGIKVAIDDFGTGYSSLSHLHNLKIDYLKIDKSFVQLIGNQNSDAVLCDVIITMAHRLQLKVIAEGVETKEQFTYLKNHRCDYIQGFYFSKPESIKSLSQRDPIKFDI